MIPALSVLVELGLTPLEAQVYAHLTAAAPLTGYQVAKAIGKPTANTYKALDALDRKGAVTVTPEGARRRYRAVPPAELLDTLEHRFQDRRRAAAAALADLQPPEDDHGLYHLRTRAQAVERARQMVGRARHAVLADLPAWLAEALGDVLEHAAAAGADILARTPAAPGFPTRLHALRTPPAGGAPERAALAVDARELLVVVAAPTGGGVRYALWTADAALARAIHELLAAELLYAAVAEGMTAGLDPDALEASFDIVQAVRALGVE